MKAFFLLVLVTMTVTLFAHSRVSMTKFDVKIMNEIVDAMYSGEVKLFAENATFDSVSAHYSPDGKTARFDITGEVTMEGDVICGQLKLTINRVTHTSDEVSWNTYTADLDTRKLESYCELHYKDARR